jgi:hypothetical protein
MKNILRRFFIVVYFLSAACGLLSYSTLVRSSEDLAALIDRHQGEIDSWYRLYPNLGEFPKDRMDFFKQERRDESRWGDIAGYVLLSTFGAVPCCFLSHFIFLGILNPFRLLKAVSD